MDKLRFALLDSTATKPNRKHASDAGVDVYASEDGTVAPFSYRVFPTGVTFEIPAGHVMQVWPKSRNHHLVGAGIVDSGYQGEILVKVVNYTETPMLVHKGEAIAQLVLVPVLTPTLVEVSEQEIHKLASARGATGGIVGQ